MKMNELDRILDGVRTAAISGHINPDGDCVGSCLGMRCYLEDNFPDINVDVYLQQPSAVFGFLKGIDALFPHVDKNKKYDLCILLDISGIDRVSDGKILVENSSKILCIDHHKTNENDGTYHIFINEPEKSSACEVLYEQLDPERISFDCAQALYTGIVHDTGVFKYSCTSPRTMTIAADLMSHGLPFTEIIDDSFYKKTYEQNVMMGEVVAGSELLFREKVVFGMLSASRRHARGLASRDLEGIVNQLGNVRDSEISAFVYELDQGKEFKVSLRSKKVIDVSNICKVFGGGGHKNAAGCNIKGTAEEVKIRLLQEVERELKAQGLI